MTTIDLFRNTNEYAAFEAGQIVFERGQPGDVMYAVLEGEVEILLGERVVDVALSGGIVGEMALIDSSPRSATARGWSPATCGGRPRCRTSTRSSPCRCTT